MQLLIERVENLSKLIMKRDYLGEFTEVEH